MNQFELWQQMAESLFDYQFIHSENKISALPVKITSAQVQKWSKDILRLVDLARHVALQHRDTHLMLRKDWQHVAELYLNRQRQHPILRPDCILKNGQLVIIPFYLYLI